MAAFFPCKIRDGWQQFPMARPPSKFCSEDIDIKSIYSITKSCRTTFNRDVAEAISQSLVVRHLESTRYTITSTCCRMPVWKSRIDTHASCKSPASRHSNRCGKFIVGESNYPCEGEQTPATIQRHNPLLQVKKLAHLQKLSPSEREEKPDDDHHYDSG